MGMFTFGSKYDQHSVLSLLALHLLSIIARRQYCLLLVSLYSVLYSLSGLRSTRSSQLRLTSHSHLKAEHDRLSHSLFLSFFTSVFLSRYRHHLARHRIVIDFTIQRPRSSTRHNTPLTLSPPRLAVDSSVLDDLRCSALTRHAAPGSDHDTTIERHDRRQISRQHQRNNTEQQQTDRKSVV